MPSLRTFPLLLAFLTPLPLAAQTEATVVERLLAAASIPGLALETRAAGVPSGELAALLDALAGRKVPATDARVVLAEEKRSAAEHGPVPGLGSFVQARLAEGLRGQALAAAIRKEHAARGRKNAPPGQAEAGRGDGRPARGQRPRKAQGPQR